MEETKAKKESVPARVPARAQFQHLLLLLLLISIDKSSAKRAYEEDVDENQELQGGAYSQNATLTCPSHHHFDVNRVMGCRYLPPKRKSIDDPSLLYYDVDFSLSRADPSLADGYTYVSKSWPKLEQHVQRNMPRMAIESFRIKEVVLLVAALIVAASAYLLKGVYSSI